MSQTYFSLAVTNNRGVCYGRLLGGITLAHATSTPSTVLKEVAEGGCK